VDPWFESRQGVRSFYIALLLTKLALHCHCAVGFEKNKLVQINFFFVEFRDLLLLCLFTLEIVLYTGDRAVTPARFRRLRGRRGGRRGRSARTGTDFMNLHFGQKRYGLIFAIMEYLKSCIKTLKLYLLAIMAKIIGFNDASL
jgi:hypothetical protein